ncbi:TetR family transcriptional regulator [Ktedonobacter robiniae]|uniref:TetR family transcriptional regulator n=1 Tax=Ktedonobacter robiniae TaxID=2778365 RepID=A0ABQ3UZ33_9CHLR|nr:TetR family transcriptional regulator [Ktedonobacter robiniae]
MCVKEEGREKNMKETSLVSKRVPRRQRLIEIGLDLFGHRSYEEISIDDIATAADISKGLLYYYFPTKHDFYVAVVEHAAQGMLQETEPDPDLEPAQRLRSSLHAYFSYVDRHAKAYVALLRGGVGVDVKVAAITDSVRQSYIQRIMENIISERPLTPRQRIAINGWVGFVEATSIAWLNQRDIDLDELCDLSVAAFATIFQ